MRSSSQPVEAGKEVTTQPARCVWGCVQQHLTSLYSSHVTVTGFKDLASKQPDILFKLAFLPKRNTKHLCASHRAGSVSQQYGSQKGVLPTLLRAATSIHCSEELSKCVQNRGLGTRSAGATQGPKCTYHSVLEFKSGNEWTSEPSEPIEAAWTKFKWRETRL